jgi:hypothetical protein
VTGECTEGAYLYTQRLVHQLSVHHDRDAELAEGGEGGRDIADARVGEVIDAGWAHERLRMHHSINSPKAQVAPPQCRTRRRV